MKFKFGLAVYASIFCMVMTACMDETVLNHEYEDFNAPKVITEEVIEPSENSDAPEVTEQPVVTEPPAIPEVPVIPEQEENASKEDILKGMSVEERREVNVFLSNFSEAFYYPNGMNDAEEKISFAFSHAALNKEGVAFDDGEHFCIMATDVDEILVRFFGSSVPHQTPENSRWWIYRDGKFLGPLGSGETHASFSVATSMTKRADGNFDVLFNVYNDPSVIAGDVLTDKSVYYLTDAEAAAAHIYKESGSAILKAKVYNGKNTYELVDYNIINARAQMN